MQYYKFIRQPDDDWLKYAQKIPPHSQQIFLSKDFLLQRFFSSIWDNKCFILLFGHK